MNTEIICALISLGTVVASALVAFLTARSTSKRETERLKMSFEHADVVSSDNTFSEMAGLVAEFLRESIGLTQREALRSVAVIRAVESGIMGEKLDALHDAILCGRTADVNRLLHEVIREKRNRKENGRTGKVQGQGSGI